MNCEYCGCALPDEWRPNCKQCGAPRKELDIDALALRTETVFTQAVNEETRQEMLDALCQRRARTWDPADNIFFPDSWSWVEFNTGRQ